MSKLPPGNLNSPRISAYGLGAKVVKAQPLVGVERDELTAQVMRLKRAAEAMAQPRHNPKTIATPSTAAQNWAESWQLPKEVFEYFTLESA
jgi:hypothetical protein